MYKVGDRVIYIKKDLYELDELILNNIYTILYIDFNYNLVIIKEDKQHLNYYIDCFMTVSDQRKKKLQKICLK